MKNFKNTKDVMRHALQYVSGTTIDFGAGNAKYQGMIVPKTTKYVRFDMVEGKNIDVVGDVLNSPFENQSFDTVVSTQVLEHVEKPWIMVKEIGRIIKVGGICIATAPFIVPYHADPYDFFRYTKTGLESLFKSEGFEVVESGTYGKIFSVLSEMFHFSFFNPYEGKGKSINEMRILRFVERISTFLDKFIKNKIIYTNVYVIMRKIK